MYRANHTCPPYQTLPVLTPRMTFNGRIDSAGCEEGKDLVKQRVEKGGFGILWGGEVKGLHLWCCWRAFMIRHDSRIIRIVFVRIVDFFLFFFFLDNLRIRQMYFYFYRLYLYCVKYIQVFSVGNFFSELYYMLRWKREV